MQTTRRFDALKLFVSLRCLGRKKFARMIDSTIELAEEAASLIEGEEKLELANYPAINAVVFRYVSSERANQINSQIRMRLIKQGIAILAQTKIGELTYLKFTLLNPCTSIVDIKRVLQAIQEIGDELLGMK